MGNGQIRVRFAPSPTGYLHIGSARTALYNWLYARKTGGAFILRIEDTDAVRSSRESYEVILQALEWLGLTWDEGPEKGGPYGPYLQSARLVLYHTEAQKLLGSGMAYACFCSQDELREVRREALRMGEQTKYDGRCRNLPRDEVERRLSGKVPHVIRFKIPDGETRFKDIIRGAFRFKNSELDDFVLVKSDGRPTYNFAVVVDDVKMRITHVIRGDDHISNTPKQVLLYRALGYPLPKFAHLPMILGSDRTRLSKRHGATSVQEFRQMGYLSDALVNYLALLGWSFDGKMELFSRDSLIEKFSLGKVSKNPAAFDIEKLKYINAEHFKKMEPMKRVALVYEKLEEEGILPPDFRPREWESTRVEGTDWPRGREEDIVKGAAYREELPRLAFIVRVMGNRLKSLGDAPELFDYFFKDDYTKDPSAYEKHLRGPGVAHLLFDLARALEELDSFDRAGIERVVRDLAEKLGISAASLIHPCRVALTGRSVSPDLFSVIYLLGKEKCSERLRAAAEQILGASKRG